ncbi:MAG: flippase-like domain-containing protein [Chitinophagaceae bacterium]|nr:flippase-like domain-containing protein [Chitinophagaceae bacterium]
MPLKSRHKKLIRIFIRFFLGPVLFAWLSYSIYKQIQQQPHLESSWHALKHSMSSTMWWILPLVFLGMILNWSIESVKWMLVVKRIQPVKFITACKAVLSGLSFSVTTPNRVGEYLGRVLYMDDGNRMKAISLTITGSISQLITTLFMGLMALLVLKDPLSNSGLVSSFWYSSILYGTLFVTVILTVFYFRINWLVRWVDRLPGNHRYKWLIETLESFDATILTQLLSLSAARFVIFILQYWLLCSLFDVEISWWDCYWTVSLSYLVMAAIPTIALFTDLSLRGTVSIQLLGIYSSNHLGIGLAAASMWLINLIIPALAGSLLILGIGRIIRKNGKDSAAEQNNRSD